MHPVSAPSRTTAACSALFAAVLLIPCVGVAQDASKYYTVQHPQEFKTDWTGFYRQADALTAQTRQGLPNKLDLAYGKDVKQRLDLYFPTQRPAHAPVFLFLHGGGFREGDRAQYGFIAKPFAEHGIITAVASYRLTPEGFRYPDQLQDVKLAYEWLYHNIEHYGGNRNRLYVGGHSSGAILAAEIGVDRGWLVTAGIPKTTFRGILPISGEFDLRTSAPEAEKVIYWNEFTRTQSERAAASPLLHIVDPVPALVAVGGLETQTYADFVSGSRDFVTELSAGNVDARLMVLDGKAHKDVVLDLGDVHGELSAAAAKFIESH